MKKVLTLICVFVLALSVMTLAACGNDTYTLTYSAGDGGYISGRSAQTVREGDDGSQVAAVADDGYVFERWSDGFDVSVRTDRAVNANMHFKAYFRPLGKFSARYVSAGGGVIEGETEQTVEEGGDCSAVKAVADDGYRFVIWSDGVLTAERTDYGVKENFAVTAYFAGLETHMVTYFAGSGGYIDGSAAQLVTDGGDAETVTAVPFEGFRFVKWSDGVLSAERSEKNVTGDKSVTAMFAAEAYNVRYIALNGGRISGNANQTVGHGENASAVLAVPYDGYEFVRWDDGVTTPFRCDANIKTGFTRMAHFALKTYQLCYDALCGGYIAGQSAQTVAHGEDGAAVTAVANPGFEFIGWSDGVTEETRTDLGVTGDLSVTARFKATDRFILLYGATEGGFVSGDTIQTVYKGGNGNAVEAVASEGYRFVKWSDGMTSAVRTDAGVVGNVFVTAVFEKTTYELLYQAEQGGYIDGNARQEVQFGEYGSLVTAVANEGYEFVGWSDGIESATRTDPKPQNGEEINIYPVVEKVN